ncbi:3-oxoacyl-[acyl-carrier-protein] reductase [Tissierella praeacuta DSM 18095]|uniref:3-oxoacyl-[acyl-carrier-protein] reductase n=1 Tax=Tissierella praeacuta DSM 18095 TaxID=1123404 RepID=A0A1M4W4P7_9FIRM|nr:3-oxoacyl-[acyl-carrier-protein] reductase [Tissierella praeacuta]SHE76231.1 3-oxoacyl-[acyl-carrier-protein] reductase [Tissierella praeacuta DSM 18095]SUP00088.1 3-oxoacyl-[acyl-carrier-protein] reductase FabG [Tissierella praeacuta]
MSLKDKAALITGGSRGIGKEIALELARNGVHIGISYVSNTEKANEVLEEIKSYGVNAIAVKANVSVEEEVFQMIKTIEEELGTIDILVNNAGITKDNLLIRMKEQDWDEVMDVNLKGVFLCTKAVSRIMMKKRYGKIINITSVVGITGNVGQGNYSASKAGVIGFTKSMARELASRGIRVNGIAPGFIETDMTDVLKDEIKEAMLKTIPLNSFGNPKDIANLAVFLASESSDYITGQIINVDGGMIMT